MSYECRILDTSCKISAGSSREQNSFSPSVNRRPVSRCQAGGDGEAKIQMGYPASTGRGTSRSNAMRVRCSAPETCNRWAPSAADIPLNRDGLLVWLFARCATQGSGGMEEGGAAGSEIRGSVC
jgi:hypothetical protein